MTEPRTIPYRSDVDGLRAVAVLAVIFHHAEFLWARGGYIGVDIFFVISGFLITGILLREHQDGSFSLARFYERRARRILPALLVVLGTTLLACSIVMFDADRRIVARTAVSVLGFAANFLFWAGVDFGQVATLNYFNRRIHEQPFAHTWSLGVEEQYYLLFPLALMAILHLPKTQVRRILLGAALLSFGLCASLTARHQSLAFYLLPTRFWELLIGGFVAWYGAAMNTPASRRELIAAVGACLILAPIYVFTEHSPFPGVHAAAPVIGTALVIRYAEGTRTSALLAWRPLVFIGLISYSAYLWHQPLFALARYLELSRPLGLTATITLIALTLVLAAVTWRWIETPFRDRRRVTRRALAWSLGTATLAVAATASLWAFTGDAGRRSPIATNVVSQSALSLFTDCNFSTQPTRRLGFGCLLDPSSTEAPSFLVVGDSHADAMFPAFAKISRDSGRQGRLVYTLSCPALIHFNGVPAGVVGCRQMQQAALEMIARDRISDVFLIARFANYEPRDAFAARLETTIATYAERGANLYLVVHLPEQPHFNARRWARARLWLRLGMADPAHIVRSQSASRDEHDAQRAAAEAVYARFRDDRRVKIIDLTSVFCDAQTCPAGTAERPFFVDDNHVSPEGALLASEAFAPYLSSPSNASSRLALPSR